MANSFRVNWWKHLERAFFALASLGVCVLFLEKLLWSEILAELFSFWDWSQLAFGSIASTTDSLVLPTLIAVASAFLIIQIFPTAPPRWIRFVVMGILLLLLGRYFLWRVFASFNLDDPLNGTLSIAFITIEVFGWILGISSLFLAVLEKDRTAEADAMSEAVLQGKYVPWVDIFVPTYNESVEMLQRTIIGCQGMDYPYKRVFLLDDRRRPEMKRLAEELGCFYLTRPDNRHAKAGNINNALGKTCGELIALFDCDFVPTRNFLTRTIGFFQQPDVALVQTNKAYYNSDPIRHNLGLQSALNNDEDIFFGAILSGRDTLNSVICCGSSFVVRRQALDKIGGIPTETLTEDFVTSLKIQSLGDRVIYLNEALSAGLAAENIGGYIDQRLRWGQGTIQSLFCEANPFTLPGLNLIQRFIHGLGILYWFQSAVYILFLCLPLGYLWFDIAPIRATFAELLFFFLPYYATFAVVFAWLNGGRRSVFWAEVYATIIAFPVAFMVINTCINPFGKGFKVTPKGVLARKAVLNWQAAAPLVIMFVLYLVAITTAFFNWQWVLDSGTAKIGLFWAFYNTCILYLAIQIAIDVPQEVLAIRFPHQLPCKLHLADKVLYGETNTISEWGTDSSFTLYQKLKHSRVKSKSGNACEDWGAVDINRQEEKNKDTLPNSNPGETSPSGDYPNDKHSDFSGYQEIFAGAADRTIKKGALDIPDLGLFDVPVTFRKAEIDKKNESLVIELKFSQLSLNGHRKLVNFVFGQPNRWREQPLSEVKSFWSLISSVFRIYPLTRDFSDKNS